MRSSKKFEVRILRPVEFEKLRDAMDPDTKRICVSLLLTGTRYAELQRLRENLGWLEGILCICQENPCSRPRQSRGRRQ